MIYPIVAYGSPILKKRAEEINETYPNLKQLVEDMFETMEEAGGVGLAAPQIDLSIRLFVVDAEPFAEEDPKAAGFKRAFINPIILEESGEEWDFNEGCLSVPDIHEDVRRRSTIRIKYFDVDFKEHEEVFDGYVARIIQHEYDHIEGKTFVDRLNPLKRTLLKKRLENISKGEIKLKYRMKFSFIKKRKI